MEASAGLVAGSHHRNELVVIRRDGESAVCPNQPMFHFFLFLINNSINLVSLFCWSMISFSAYCFFLFFFPSSSPSSSYELWIMEFYYIYVKWVIVNCLIFMGSCAGKAVGAGKWGSSMRDMQWRSWAFSGGRSVRGVQWVRLPGLQNLLRLRAPRRQPSMPPMQNSLQTPQGYVCPYEGCNWLITYQHSH